MQSLKLRIKLELWATSLSDTTRLQYYDIETLEYELTKNIHLGVATSTRRPFSWKYKLNYLPF